MDDKFWSDLHRKQPAEEITGVTGKGIWMNWKKLPLLLRNPQLRGCSRSKQLDKKENGSKGET